jgi:hypothetical protein
MKILVLGLIAVLSGCFVDADLSSTEKGLRAPPGYCGPPEGPFVWCGEDDGGGLGGGTGGGSGGGGSCTTTCGSWGCTLRYGLRTGEGRRTCTCGTSSWEEVQEQHPNCPIQIVVGSVPSSLIPSSGGATPNLHAPPGYCGPAEGPFVWCGEDGGGGGGNSGGGGAGGGGGYGSSYSCGPWSSDHCPGTATRTCCTSSYSYCWDDSLPSDADCCFIHEGVRTCP